MCIQSLEKLTISSPVKVIVHFRLILKFQPKLNIPKLANFFAIRVNLANLPSVSYYVSATPGKDSPVYCGPGWPCCAPPVSGSSLLQSETASSAGLSVVSAWIDSLPAEQTISKRYHLLWINMFLKIAKNQYINENSMNCKLAWHFSTIRKKVI